MTNEIQIPATKVFALKEDRGQRWDREWVVVIEQGFEGNRHAAAVRNQTKGGGMITAGFTEKGAQRKVKEILAKNPEWEAA